MPIIEDLEQGTPDWLAMRLGCVTASRMSDVMAKFSKKDGDPAAKLHYKNELVFECLSGLTAEAFVTDAMQDGIDNEPLARTEYELKLNVDVQRVGLAFHPTIERFAASPDGLVGKDGLIEIKCPKPAQHLNCLMTKAIPEDYQWQMLAQMACTGRKWCDFVSFDPRLPKNLQLFIQRFEREGAKINGRTEDDMEAEVIKFLGEVQEIVLHLKTL